MKVHAINDSISSSPQLDLNEFAKELRALSDRFDLKLVSMGAMTGLDSEAKGTTYHLSMDSTGNMHRRAILICLLLCGVTLAAFWPVSRSDWGDVLIAIKYW